MPEKDGVYDDLIEKLREEDAGITIEKSESFRCFCDYLEEIGLTYGKDNYQDDANLYEWCVSTMDRYPLLVMRGSEIDASRNTDRPIYKVDPPVDFSHVEDEALALLEVM